MNILCLDWCADAVVLAASAALAGLFYVYYQRPGGGSEADSQLTSLSSVSLDWLRHMLRSSCGGGHARKKSSDTTSCSDMEYSDTCDHAVTRDKPASVRGASSQLESKSTGGSAVLVCQMDTLCDAVALRQGSGRQFVDAGRDENDVASLQCGAICLR